MDSFRDAVVVCTCTAAIAVLLAAWIMTVTAQGVAAVVWWLAIIALAILWLLQCPVWLFRNVTRLASLCPGRKPVPSALDAGRG